MAATTKVGHDRYAIRERHDGTWSLERELTGQSWQVVWRYPLPASESDVRRMAENYLLEWVDSEHRMITGENR